VTWPAIFLSLVFGATGLILQANGLLSFEDRTDTSINRSLSPVVNALGVVLTNPELGRFDVFTSHSSIERARSLP